MGSGGPNNRPLSGMNNMFHHQYDNGRINGTYAADNSGDNNHHATAESIKLRVTNVDKHVVNSDARKDQILETDETNK